MKRPVTGIVLCGGRSSRMGRDKAWLDVRGEPLVVRTVRIVSEVAAPVIVAAADGQVLPLLPGEVIVVRDEVAARGPLGGLAAAMSVMTADSAFVTACDMPNLDAGMIGKICADQSMNCVPVVNGLPQPLAAHYRKAILSVIHRQLESNRFSLKELLTLIPVSWVSGIDPEAFVNLNTPDEYERMT